MPLQPGSQPVPGCPDYVLVRKLGAGAFGEVWQANGPGGFDVALKFIRLDAHVRDVELRSLEVMKRIRHPNLVSLFGAWLRGDWLILAMELCDRTLQDRLREALAQDLPGIPTDELLGYMRDAAAGLDALNAKKVQHRDVKPANLLLLDSGVKVGDFGLAKALEQTVASNSGAGTVAYLAPECFKGQLAKQSDQYSLAVTYYHLRTGRLLFEGNQAEIMYGHLEADPDLLQLPDAERSVLVRALAKRPETRWPNCKSFISGLTNAAVSPANASFFLERGIAWTDRKHYGKAIYDFDEAIRLAPGLAAAYNARGVAHLLNKTHQKAIADINEAIRLDPNYAAELVLSTKVLWYPFDPETAWLFLMIRGSRWATKKDYGCAFRDYNQALRLNPKSDLIFRKRGYAHLVIGRFQDAIDDFSAAVRIDLGRGEEPNASDLTYRGLAWLGNNDPGRAAKDLDAAIRVDLEAVLETFKEEQENKSGVLTDHACLFFRSRYGIV